MQTIVGYVLQRPVAQVTLDGPAHTLVQTIGDSAPYQRTGLAVVTPDSSVQKVGAYAFYQFTGLAEVAVMLGNFVRRIVDRRSATAPASRGAGGQLHAEIGLCALHRRTTFTEVTPDNPVRRIGHSALFLGTGSAEAALGSSVQAIVPCAR